MKIYLIEGRHFKHIIVDCKSYDDCMYAMESVLKSEFNLIIKFDWQYTKVIVHYLDVDKDGNMFNNSIEYSYVIEDYDKEELLRLKNLQEEVLKND